MRHSHIPAIRRSLPRFLIALLPTLAIVCAPSLAPAQTIERGSLTLEQAIQALDAAEAEARRNGWNVTIVVADTGGIPVSLRRLDGASVMSYNFAMGKVRTSAASGLSTLEYREGVEAGTVAPVPDAVTIEGGIPLIVGGRLLGAIATSGVAAQNDAIVSRAGAAALGNP